MAQRPCLAPGCAALVTSGRCPQHQARRDAQVQQEREAYNAARGSATQRGYDAEWDALRKRYLASHPTCARCGSTDSLDVHHIKPVREAPELRLTVTNFVTLCRSCHKSTHAGGQ